VKDNVSQIPIAVNKSIKNKTETAVVSDYIDMLKHNMV
jgi:hypothetical protein